MSKLIERKVVRPVKEVLQSVTVELTKEELEIIFLLTGLVCDGVSNGGVNKHRSANNSIHELASKNLDEDWFSLRARLVERGDAIALRGIIKPK